MNSESPTVAEVLDRGKQLRAEFEKRQAELAEAQQAYRKAKIVIVDFTEKYGAIMKLFEDG